MPPRIEAFSGEKDIGVPNGEPRSNRAKGLPSTWECHSHSSEAETILLRLEGLFSSSSFREKLDVARVEGGAYIRDLREQAAISQKELASYLKISAAFLCHIESGRINLPQEKVQPLALGVRCLDRREFAARLLYAYRHPLFAALGGLDIQTIRNVKRVELSSFDIIPSGNDLSSAEDRRGRRHSVMGTRLRLRRQELGLSQESMKDYIGYSGRTAISNIEYGVGRITYPYFVKWCRALQTTSSVMASFLLYYCERTLFLLADESEESIYDGVELEMLSAIPRKAGNSITSTKYRVGTPYKVGKEARVDIVCELLGSKEVLCIHRNLNTAVGRRYWLTDGNGKPLLEQEFTCLDALVKAI